jgi:hypothetical protein
MPLVRRKPAPVGRNPGTAYAHVFTATMKVRCAMSVLLTLLMIYFVLVMLWAAPRLYRLLRTRLSLLLSAYAAPDCYHATRHADPVRNR